MRPPSQIFSFAVIAQFSSVALNGPPSARKNGRLTRPFGVLSELISDPAGYSSGTRADWATGAVTIASIRPSQSTVELFALVLDVLVE